MKKPTEILSEEHQNILKVIDALLKECDVLESGKDLDRDFFEKAIDFIRNYADKFHHAKEEDILFVELNRNEEQMPCNPVEQMLYEHDLGRNFVKGFKEGVEEDNKAKIIENTRGYAYLLQDHINKEDNILYLRLLREQYAHFPSSLEQKRKREEQNLKQKLKLLEKMLFSCFKFFYKR